jgi:thioredoxin reductase (NADPH)
MTNPILEKRRDQMFPKLTAAQIARLEARGQRVQTHAGEILMEPGDRPRKFYVVVSGDLEILIPRIDGQSLLYVLTPGDFTGEMSMLRGSAVFVRLRVRVGGALIAVDTDKLRDIVQTDAELSEILMRAFILRRVGLIAEPNANVMLLGSNHSADTLRVREFLLRNAVPYVNMDVESDADVQAVLERFHVRLQDIPVVICRGEIVLKNPSNRALAECLGVNPQVDDSVVHDFAIVGAGPAGLAAAVYGASEGLDVRMVEAAAPGGQAGTSSKIENYLGFPTGISGQALTGRALSQAQKFGARLSVASQAVALRCDQRPYTIELAEGSSILASTVLIASGAHYRTLQIAEVPRFLGTGIYYAATALEAKLCEGEDAIIVGGGNSAGQAAVFLAMSCRHVHILVRSAGLGESMSRYLIRRIEESPNISLHSRTEIVGLDGGAQLESVTWRENSNGATYEHSIRHVFLMMGASPRTDWLRNCVSLDGHGFVKTGMDLTGNDLEPAHWPLARTPYLMETSLPGVFAAGDVRSGSVKRVAAAVGEGSGCVQFVHRALRELSIPVQQRTMR